MSKMGKRDKILLLIVGVCGALYVFYAYLLSPLKTETETIKAEIETLEIQTESKNEEVLKNQKDTLVDERNNFKNEIGKIQEEKNFGVVDYKKLITYMGEKAEEYNVDITMLEKQSAISVNSYWELSYETKVQGNYKDIIKFINALYGYDSYFVVSGLDMREVANIPMTDKIEVGDAELKKVIKFPWADGFFEKLDKTIPSEYLTSEDSEDGSDATDEEVTNTNRGATKDFYVNEKIQVHFLFNFISLEEPEEY